MTGRRLLWPRIALGARRGPSGGGRVGTRAASRHREKMVREAGTLVYGRVDQEMTKGVFVARVRIRGTTTESAWILAIPAKEEDARARKVPMTGGSGTETPAAEYTVLIAVRSMTGFKPNRPKRGGIHVRTWKDPESAPRLDALQALVNDPDAAPFDPRRPEEFQFSDTDPTTKEWAESGSEDEDHPAAGRSRKPRLEVVSEEEDEDLLERASRLLGKAPIRPRQKKRRDQDDDSEEEERRGAERSRREGAGGERDRKGRERSPSYSEASSRSRGGRRDRDRGRDRGRRRRRGRGSSTDSSSDSRSSKSERTRPTRGHGSRKIATYEKLKANFQRSPKGRWEFLEKQARAAGYSTGNAVELYVGECTKLGKARGTAYIATLLARIGHEAANGRAELAAGLAGAALGFLDSMYLQGEADLAWRATLSGDPVVVARTPALPKQQSLPESNAKVAGAGSVSINHRSRFSQLIPPEVLEGTLEAGKQWKAWDELTRA